jgi:hypothetical protein
MVKVEERGSHQKFDKGWETLEELVQKRIGPDALLESVIEREALEFLIRYSGGHPRQLMMFLRQCATLVDREPVTLSAARKSISGTVEMYGNTLTRYLPKLAELELSTDQSVDVNDELIKDMLRENVILAYRNGGTEKDPFTPSVTWYAVHPIIRELDQFEMAVDELREERKKKSEIGYGKE